MQVVTLDFYEETSSVAWIFVTNSVFSIKCRENIIQLVVLMYLSSQSVNIFGLRIVIVTGCFVY